LKQLEYFQAAVPKRHGFDLVQTIDHAGSNSGALGLSAFGTVEAALARPLEQVSLALKEPRP